VDRGWDGADVQRDALRGQMTLYETRLASRPAPLIFHGMAGWSSLFSTTGRSEAVKISHEK